MKLHKRHAIPLVVVLAALAAGSYAIAGGGSKKFDESLSGYQEDPLTLSTTGTGTFRAEISNDGDEIDYRLRYSGLEGNVLQAHIHFGGAAQSGGISVFLCTNLGNGPAGTQLCPAAPATITGTISRCQRDRAGRTGDHGRAVRRARPGDEGGRHLRERPLEPVPRR